MGRFEIYSEVGTAGFGDGLDMGMRERGPSRIAPKFLALSTR